MTTANNTTNATFNNINDLYADMVKGYQSFTKSENEYTADNAPIMEGETIYRLVEITKGKLHFHSNKFGGSELLINGNIQSTEKVDKLDNAFSEYRIYIDGRNEPLVLLACKKR